MTFPFLWRCFEKQWICATITANGKDTDLVQDADYSITLLQDTSGGSVSLQAPLPKGVQLTVWMQVPITQESAYQNSGTLNVKTLETGYDKLTLIAQQQQNTIDRAVKVSVTSSETPENFLESLYQARDTAVKKAAAASDSADKAEKSATEALGGAAEALASAMRSCACADRSEQARDVVMEQAELVNQLMAVEMGKVNALIAANKDDQLAAIRQALAWAITPHNVPVRVNPETNEAEYSALHWAEVARRSGLEEATTDKFGIVRLALALEVEQGHSTAVVTAAQLKERTSPATESKLGVGRIATVAEVKNGVTGENGPAFLTPEIVQMLVASFNPTTSKFYYPGYAGQFESFQLPTPPVNWRVCTGGWLENADVSYPELWRNLQHPAFATLVLRDAQWIAKSTTAGGVGGVPFFVVDVTAKRIRLPDTRGDYTRAAGSSYLQAVGGGIRMI